MQEQTQYIDYCIEERTDQDINRTSTTTTCRTDIPTSEEVGTSPNTVDTATESDVNTHHKKRMMIHKLKLKQLKIMNGCDK